MDLKNLSDKEYIEGIKLCIENAQTLFKFGNHARIEGNFGLANSLFILSCEEAIKAFSIYNAITIGDGRDISSIFRNHKYKLAILKEGYELISSETKAMDKSFKQAKKELPKAGNEEIEKRANELYKKYYNELLEKITEKEIESNREWWDKANMNKQNGFYVGFDGGKWVSPATFSEREVNVTAQKALLILGHVLRYKDINEGVNEK